MFRGLSLLMIAVFLIVVLSLPGFCRVLYSPWAAESPAPSPSPPIDMASLFRDDICTPPCWFGLTPGISTAEDVRVFFETFSDLFYDMKTYRNSTFDPETGNMISGTYHFHWDATLLERTDVILTFNVIRVEHGTVNKLEIDMPQEVLLEDVLNELGEPNVIIAGGVGGWQPLLYLYYLDVPLIISLIADRDSCSVSDIRDSFRIDTVIYYPSEHALDPRPEAPEDWSRFVPQETWRTWNSGEVNVKCREAWEQLPIG